MENNKAFTIEISQKFNVPVQSLYEAWTETEHLKKWWKPMGNQLEEVSNDITPGGVVSYGFGNDSLLISGEYLEAEAGKRLVYTWDWELPKDPIKNSSYKLSVTFADADNGSELKIVQENFKDDESMVPHQQGWDKALADLKNFLESGGNEDINHQDNEPSAADEREGTGYHEMPEQQKVAGG